MKMKKISAVSMKDAMELARRELGENAVLIDSKKAANGNGMIVTFAIDEPDEMLFDDAPNYADILPFSPDIAKPATSKVELAHPAYTLIRDAMEYHSLPTALAEKLLGHIMRQSLKPDALIDVAENTLATALKTTIAFKPFVTATKTPPERALMLVGPHGTGKTSTIAKLATELTLQKQPVVLISTDTERLGGVDALHTLAGLLKCEVVVSDSRRHLKNLVAKLQGKAWMFVDSSGANIYEFAGLKALGEFASLQGVEPILTCPAGMDSQEAEEMAGVFQFLTIDRMIITRLDAVRRLGSVFSTLTASGYALANFTHSAIPTDACQPASAAALARLMLRHARERLTH
jgi:flagellar biosynthesis protein FlhF